MEPLDQHAYVATRAKHPFVDGRLHEMTLASILFTEQDDVLKIIATKIRPEEISFDPPGDLVMIIADIP
jgi:hypothetical protein